MMYLDTWEKYEKDFDIAHSVFDANKYEWAASHVFEICTDDGELDEIFVKKIIEVCRAILESRTFEYIEDKDNYIAYIIVCQLLYEKGWIEWGTSIRGAWFVRNGIESNAKPILSMNLHVPYSIDNLELLFKFLEE